MFKKSSLFLFILCIILSCCQSAKTPFESEKEKQIITKKLNDCFGWARNKDFDLFYSVIANDSNFRSITPYDKVKFGIADVKQEAKFWVDPRFKAVSHQIKDLKITFSGSHNNAWFYCKIDDFNTWEGKEINWENTRWTGILEKRNNDWKIVQHHFSFAHN